MKVSVCDKCYFEGKLKRADYRFTLRDDSLRHRYFDNPRRRMTGHLCDKHFHLLKKEIPEVTIKAYLEWIGYGFSLKKYVTQVSTS